MGFGRGVLLWIFGGTYPHYHSVGVILAPLKTTKAAWLQI